MKLALFHSAARNTIQVFPVNVRKEIGKAIFDIQCGYKLCMPLSRPMPSVSIGVEELRIRDKNGSFRVFYYMKYSEAILIFHAFIKKTEKTPQSEINLAQSRLREMLNEKK